MSLALEVRDVQAVYGGKVALDVPHLTVEKGTTLSVIGPNGSGKSTLLRVLGLLERPAGGDVLLDGQPVDHRGDVLAYRRRMAVVMQEPLLRNASVFENVATGLRFRRVAASEIRGRVEAWLDRLGIAHLAGRNARTLSGGEAQRTSLARAFVLQPEVLLLDEPFAALDAPSRETLIDDVRRILAETGITAVLVTHDRTEALALGDRLAVLIAGSVRQVDVPEVVLGAPASEEVAAFVGVENIVRGRVGRAQEGLAVVEAQGGEIVAVGDYAVGERVLACIRPEDVVLESPDSHPSFSSARNRVRGRVVWHTPLGAQFRVVLDCGFPLVSLVTKQSFSELPLTVGAEAIASFKASAVHIIRRSVG